MVYVDDMYKISLGAFRNMKMSHLMADTTEELLALADAIGMNKKWLQEAGTNLEHFDVSVTKRNLALKNGAVEVPMRQLARAAVNRKSPNDLLLM